MSNETIAIRLLEVVRSVLNGSSPASAFADAVDAHAPAFEGLPRSWIDRLNGLSVQVVSEDVSALESEVLGIQHSIRSLQEAEAMLEALCDPAQQSIAADRAERPGSG
jgi:hypothetical protein